jgi:hypothetical protein
VGTPLCERSKVKVYKPVAHTKQGRSSPVYQTSSPWLLKEDIEHFSLLVPKICSEGSMTRKRSREEHKNHLTITNGNNPELEIEDRLFVNKKSK